MGLVEILAIFYWIKTYCTYGPKVDPLKGYLEMDDVNRFWQQNLPRFWCRPGSYIWIWTTCLTTKNPPGNCIYNLPNGKGNLIFSTTLGSDMLVSSFCEGNLFWSQDQLVKVRHSSSSWSTGASHPMCQSLHHLLAWHWLTGIFLLFWWWITWIF